MPRLSIITINLNNPIGLQRTIKSVLQQTYSDFEWIIIDGGSNEIDINLIKQYSNLFMHWRSEPDNGIYNAINKGISEATGNYCFFLNSGDSLVNERVLENVFCNELHEDVIFGNLVVMLNNKIIGKSRGKVKLSFLDLYNGLIKHQAAFIKRDLFDKYGSYNEELKIIADWEFFLKTVGTGSATYKYLDLDVSYFDNDGISNKHDSLVQKEKDYVINRYILPMMQNDYKLLQKIGRYDIVTKYRIPYFVLRIMAKVLEIFERLNHVS